MNHVAEERPLAKDHPERARFGQDTHVAGVSSDVEHRDVAGPGRRRIDDAAGAGVDAVGPDQEVSHGLGTVLEPRRYAAVRRGLGINEPLAVLDGGATPDRLIAQCPVEVGPLEGLADRAIGQLPAEGDLAEVLAGTVLDRHARRGEALGQHEVVGVYGVQGVHAVAGEGEDAAGDDQGPLRASHASSFPGAKVRQSLSLTDQSRNVAALLPMGRTRLLWNAAKRHSAPSRTATRVWIESRSGEGYIVGVLGETGTVSLAVSPAPVIEEQTEQLPDGRLVRVPRSDCAGGLVGNCRIPSFVKRDRVRDPWLRSAERFDLLSLKIHASCNGSRPARSCLLGDYDLRHEVLQHPAGGPLCSDHGPASSTRNTGHRDASASNSCGVPEIP